ncbi:hypothetical protein A7A08_00521 [Methyloligella halotolerans]|uniref:Sulfotransferase domain protein n=1 Tax=Methyloligella halotolerans TaxID=1177755 RepID=A0A1E2S2Y2_9HYPH|nr:sulfotransferase [Methyloligella halotolerans]ODA68689.1 hypothetical protein A7A08_00521 [Methyloligella halotolerans]
MVQAPPKTLLYIGGYGRSGSTLLGRILALNPDVLNLGEVITAPRFLQRPGRRCICGETLRDCPVWAPVLRGVVDEPTRFADRRTHLKLLERIAETAHKRYIVDASKTAWLHASHAFYLRRKLSIPLHMLHLVRDPRAVLWSVFRLRDERRGAPDSALGRASLAVKVAVSWVFANLAAELFRLRAGRDVTRALYNDVILKGLPAPLDEIIPGAPLTGRVLSDEAGSNHAIAGNPMRVIKSATVALDEEWCEKLPVAVGCLVSVICFPLLIRYGLPVWRWRGGTALPSHAPGSIGGSDS